MASILDLQQTIRQLPDRKRSVFDRIFAVDEHIGRLDAPQSMHPWLEKTFGSLEGVSAQPIVRVTNPHSFESALFNGLRSRRPFQVQDNSDVAQVIKGTEGDSFCTVLENTPADTFGRIKGKRSSTVANVAKYDWLHSVVVFNEHNPLQWKERDVLDYFQTAKRWIEEAHVHHPEAVYPFVMWNCLWKSSASLVHGHLQVLLGSDRHYSSVAFLNQVARTYVKEQGSSYFADLLTAHQAVGLTKKKAGIWMYANLTPRKDKEVVLISDAFDKPLWKAAYHVLSRLRDKMGVQSYNLAVLMPPLDRKGTVGKRAGERLVEGWDTFPYMIRIVDRGSLGTKTSDIGGMELYAGTNVVAADPYQVIKEL